MNTLKLDEKQQENIFIKMENAKSKWMEQIEISFMPEDFKNQYKQIVTERFERINQ